MFLESINDINFNDFSFLSEAEGDAAGGGGATAGTGSTAGATTSTGGTTPASPNTGSMDTDTTDMANETSNDSYQAEEETETTEEDPTATEEDAPTDDMGGEDDMGMGDESGAEEETGEEEAYGDEGGGAATDKEIYKKIYLLDQYNEMYEVLSSLYSNVQKYYNSANQYKYDDIAYILGKISSLRKYITFTITIKFKEYDYQKLITLYSYFEEELKQLTDLVEKVIKDDYENEQ